MSPSAEYCLYVLQVHRNGAWHVWCDGSGLPGTCLTADEATEAAQALADTGLEVRWHRYLASGYAPVSVGKTVDKISPEE